MHNQLERELQKEAEEILNNEALWQPFIANGKIHPAGSFALNLLVYPDLDVYFEATHPEKLIDIFAKGVENLAYINEVKTIRLEKDLYKRVASAPQGTYLQFKIEVSKDHTWQVDIWAIDKNLQDKVLIDQESMKKKITPKNRELILQIKHELMGVMGKTPSFSGFYVYKAVLEEGLSDINEIKNYLINHGIKLF